MPDFAYEAMTKDGHKESASIQAPSLTAAGHMLKEQGLMPTNIQEKHPASSFNFSAFKRISLNEKIVFIQNLSIMLKAGISVARALQIIGKQTQNSKFRVIVMDIHSQVESGKGLGEALGKYPNVFSNIFLSMIKVGELSGNLDKSLEYLSTQLQREADLKSKTKGAMIYPAVIVGAMVIIGILMSIFVLPQLTSVFKGFGGQLPIATRIVMAISDFMGSHGLIAVIGLIALVGAWIAMLRTYTGQLYFDIALLHAYIINTIIKKINLARFSRILSSLLKSGIPIVESLDVAANSMENIPYRELASKAAGDVKLGKPLSESLGKDTTLFPVLVIQMLQVGEESGTVDAILEQLASHYEEEVDSTLKNLSSIIEPLLLLVIGGVVGVLAMALIAPIYSISQNIS